MRCLKCIQYVISLLPSNNYIDQSKVLSCSIIVSEGCNTFNLFHHLFLMTKFL